MAIAINALARGRPTEVQIDALADAPSDAKGIRAAIEEARKVAEVQDKIRRGLKF